MESLSTLELSTLELGEEEPTGTEPEEARPVEVLSVKHLEEVGWRFREVHRAGGKWAVRRAQEADITPEDN